VENGMSARIVFDLDGTLIDSAPDIHGIANAILSEEGLEPISLAQARDFIGNGASVFVQKMRAARSIPEAEHPRLLAAFIGRYDDAVTLTVPYPGVEAALEALTAAGHRLGVCTNKPIRPCRAVLAHLRLDRHFGTVWGGDSLPVHKPDPAPLHAAFEALGDGSRLYVGDSDVDAATAQAARVPFLLFTEGYRKAPVSEMYHDLPFDDFAALPALVDRLLAETP
jgi:phosphoglycolate phosphatase